MTIDLASLTIFPIPLDIWSGGLDCNRSYGSATRRWWYSSALSHVEGGDGCWVTTKDLEVDPRRYFEVDFSIRWSETGVLEGLRETWSEEMIELSGKLTMNGCEPESTCPAEDL